MKLQILKDTNKAAAVVNIKLLKDTSKAETTEGYQQGCSSGQILNY